MEVPPNWIDTVKKMMIMNIKKKVLLEAVVTKVGQTQAENSGRVTWYPWKLLQWHHHCKGLPEKNNLVQK